MRRSFLYYLVGNLYLMQWTWEWWVYLIVFVAWLAVAATLYSMKKEGKI